jgi:hypothetical protein
MRLNGFDEGVLGNISFHGPQSTTGRAIIPKNIKANQTMNFTTSASFIWTRY